jgi:hypothetical protein
MQVNATCVPGNKISMYCESFVMAKARKTSGSRISRIEETKAEIVFVRPTVNSSLMKMVRSLGFAFNAARS